MKRYGIVLAAAVAVQLLGGWPAWAHSSLESSDPPDGSRVETAPEAITLTFSEPPDLKLSTVQVLDQTGADVQTNAPKTQGEPRSIAVRLSEELPDGTYTVTWRVVSQVDGHTTAGTFAFGVGVEPTAALPPSASQARGPTVVGVAGKALLYSGLFLIIAVVAVGAFAFGWRPPSASAILIISASAMLGGAILMLLDQQAAVERASFRDVLASTAGQPTLRLILLGLALVAGSMIWARRPTRALAVVLGVGAALALLVRARSGHAAAADPPWIQVGLQWGHMLAAAVWVGGLALVLLALRASAGTDRPPMDPVRRYSKMAGVAVALVLVAGILRSTFELGGPGMIFENLSSSYGITLSLKVVVVIGIIALGALNRARSIPRLSSGDGGLIRRIVTVEMVAAAGVVLLTAVLTSFAPPEAEEEIAPEPAPLVAVGSDFATTTRVRLTVSPGVPGSNEFEARVTDFDTGRPLPADRAALRLTPLGRADVPPSTLELRETPEGTWSAVGSALSLPGTWEAVVLIESGAKGIEIPLILRTGQPEQIVTVSSAEGRPDLYTFTLPDGSQLQAYLDPGSPGANQIHVTAFDSDGNELSLRSAVVLLVYNDGAASVLESTRFGPGHFVAEADLEPGRWAFELDALARDGQVLQASFDQAIGG
jgi:copper transport protein